MSPGAVSNKTATPAGRADAVWVLAAGTGKTTQITHDGGYAFPVFSPDGGASRARAAAS